MVNAGLGTLEYVTEEEDFPDPGGYVLQMVVTFTAMRLYSRQVLLAVDPALAVPVETS